MNNPMMVLCMISDLEKQMVFRVNLFILVRSVRYFHSKDWSSALLAVRYCKTAVSSSKSLSRVEFHLLLNSFQSCRICLCF
jgi:hypothetical protein